MPENLSPQVSCSLLRCPSVQQPILPPGDSPKVLPLELIDWNRHTRRKFRETMWVKVGSRCFLSIILLRAKFVPLPWPSSSSWRLGFVSVLPFSESNRITFGTRLMPRRRKIGRGERAQGCVARTLSEKGLSVYVICLPCPKEGLRFSFNRIIIPLSPFHLLTRPWFSSFSFIPLTKVSCHGRVLGVKAPSRGLLWGMDGFDWAGLGDLVVSDGIAFILVR